MRWNRLLALSVLAVCLGACGSPTTPQPETVSPTCGPGTPIFACPSATTHGTTPAPAPTTPAKASVTDTSIGLVPARHQDCNFGGMLMHYLATGDNAGDPWYDQHYADSVGVTEPQARAIADDAIQLCDANLDQRAAQVSAAAAAKTSAAEATVRRQRDEAEALKAKESNCATIGGRYDAQWDWCSSTVGGNPSGRAGADCRNAHVPFDGVTIRPNAIGHTLEWYPACFPS